MQPNYIASIREHAQECISELDSLSQLAQNRKLTQTEYYAAERVLQVLIEAGIGFAKQWVIALNKPVPSDAYHSFQILCDQQIISNDDLNLWKKIIGLRNILVHDYLNIERDIIDQVLNKKQYDFIFSFLKHPAAFSATR